VVGAWTLFGALIAGETYFQLRAAGRSPSLARVVPHFLAWSSTWALFTPLILWLRWRFPFNRRLWPRSLAVHIPASLFISWIGALAWVSAGQLLGRIPPGTDVLLQQSSRTFVAFLHFDPVFYWIIIGLSYLMQHYQESRERELRASQLETQLAEARLQALEMQIHPHFLFNALNTIAVLVRTGRNAQAIRVVAGLGELLRHALDSAGTQLVPLKAELEFIERYLEIEQVRFGDRLKVEMSIEPQSRDACVPYLILQPLVENAIRHGIAARATAGRLQITARVDGGQLYLGVHDDGPGLPEAKDAPSGNGLGISTTRERLQRIYGADHSFTICDVDDGGVTAQLVLPYRLATDELRGEA
jgi:sensor histidine kinase YesM